MIINGKSYKLPELDFNAVCELEEMGVSLLDGNVKPLTMIRGFVALTIGDSEQAGKEIEAHLINGGSLVDIMAEITEAIDNSGFFHALGATPTKKVSKTKTPTETKE